MGTQRKLRRQSLIKPPKPEKNVTQLKKPEKTITAGAMADTGLMFAGKFWVFILVPVTAGVPPDVAVSQFRYDFHQLKEQAAKPSIYDVYNESLKVQNKIESQEPILN